MFPGTLYVNIHSTSGLRLEDHWQMSCHQGVFFCCSDGAMKRSPPLSTEKKCLLSKEMLERNHAWLKGRGWAVLKAHVRTCLLIVQNWLEKIYRSALVWRGELYNVLWYFCIVFEQQGHWHPESIRGGTKSRKGEDDGKGIVRATFVTSWEAVWEHILAPTN